MKQKIISALVILSAITSANAANAKSPLHLKPTSAWHVDYADERCRLARQFGEGEDLVYAFFDRYSPTEYFRLSLIGQPMKTAITNADARLQFGPSENEQKLLFLNGFLDEKPALLFVNAMRVAPPTAEEYAAATKSRKDDWIAYAEISETRKKAITYLSVGKPLSRSVILETGSMLSPLNALDKCIDNLVATWGIDVEKHRSLTRVATPKQAPSKWIVSSDYPKNMLLARQSAIIEFRLNVGPDGTPTACRIQSTTRPKEFDDAVCKSVMRRARFLPALDADGVPIASYYRDSVHFRIR